MIISLWGWGWGGGGGYSYNYSHLSEGIDGWQGCIGSSAYVYLEVRQKDQQIIQVRCIVWRKVCHNINPTHPNPTHNTKIIRFWAGFT